MLNKLKTLFASRKAKPKEEIDPEVLALAKEIVFDRSLAGKNGRKGKSSYEELDRKLSKNPAEIMANLYKRTIPDIVLSNKFSVKGVESKEKFTVKRAHACDGLRDIDDTKVSVSASSPVNPEGIIDRPLAVPHALSASNDIRRRYNEALDPRGFASIPDTILEHFAEFATFIGYPACEVIAAHPTVSNACSIPGEDAIAPGYKLQYLDSEDINGNGVNDDREGDASGLKNTKTSLAKMRSLQILNEAVAKLTARKDKGPDSAADSMRDSLDSLVLALERLAAYEKFSDRNRELIAPLTEAISEFIDKPADDSKDRAFRFLLKTIAAMDGGDFDFEEEPTLDGQPRPDEAQAQQVQPESGDPGEGNAEILAAMQQQREAEKSELEKKAKKEQSRKAAEKAKYRQKLLDQWKRRADDMGINDICRKLATHARVYGIGIAIPIVEGADYEKPMDIGKITHGAYKGFTVVEPTWIYPETNLNDLLDPLSRYFFEPEYWQLISEKVSSYHRVHRSWMVIVRNKEVPNRLRPMYYFGGIPLTQEIFEAVYCADKVMNEAPKLAMTKRTFVVKGDGDMFVTDPEGTVERLSAMAKVQDNFGRLYVDRNTDVTQLETSLSEFDQLISKCNQRVAAIAKMPETKLFKTQLAGMNSAGRYEWDDYSQLLINIQNNWFTPILNLHYLLDSMSQNGEAVAVKVVWNAIDVPTADEKADSVSRSVQTVLNAIQGEMLSPDEGRTILRSLEDSMFSSLPAENPVDEEKEEEEKKGQLGMGLPSIGDPGSPLDPPSEKK